MYYTYIHYTADTNQPFYIGKGKDNRAFQTGLKRSKYWNRKVAKHNGFMTQICANFINENDAFEHEKFLILCFKEMGYTLVNLSDGGEGPAGVKRTDSQKEHLRNMLKGKPRSKETIEKIKKGTKIGMAKSEKAMATLKNNFKDSYKKRYPCLYCDIVTTATNISRYHNQKCKKKPQSL